MRPVAKVEGVLRQLNYYCLNAFWCLLPPPQCFVPPDSSLPPQSIRPHPSVPGVAMGLLKVN